MAQKRGNGEGSIGQYRGRWVARLTTADGRRKAIYGDTQGQTRVARLRLNNGGSWSFREHYNTSGIVARTYTGTSWPEQTRTIDFRFTYRLNSSAGFWNARYDVSGGNYLSNVCQNATCTSEYLWLRQTTTGGAPTNCPP